MPTTRNFNGTGADTRYRISCSHCGTSVTTDSPWSRDALTPNGNLVRETFPFVSSRDRFYSRCRECDRALAPRFQNRQARRSTQRATSTARRQALGIARPFGVEFECAVPSNVSRAQITAALQAEGLRGWSVKGDGSIYVPGMTGVEIVSPVLSGEAGEEAVRKAARALRSLGAKVNRSCGTHVHHDANDLTVEEIQRVARGWFNNQRIIDGLVSPSRRGGSGECSSYCPPLSEGDIQTVESATRLEQLRSLRISRYRALNLTSYGRHGTIEVRQHQGTLDAEKVISWLRLGQAIIDTAKVTTTPVAQQATVRTFFAALGDRLNETARTFLLGRAVEFNSVAV